MLRSAETHVCVLFSPGSEYRLRELCKELLGPVHKSASTAWEPTTLVGSHSFHIVLYICITNI